MLAIARAVIESRRLLLIDEPTKGLAPSIIAAMIEAFAELKRTTTMLVVEQNFRFARELGDTVAVMDSGRVVHRGRMDALAGDAQLQQSLLGLDLGARIVSPTARAVAAGWRGRRQIASPASARGTAQNVCSGARSFSEHAPVNGSMTGSMRTSARPICAPAHRPAPPIRWRSPSEVREPVGPH